MTKVIVRVGRNDYYFTHDKKTFSCFSEKFIDLLTKRKLNLFHKLYFTLKKLNQTYLKR